MSTGLDPGPVVVVVVVVVVVAVEWGEEKGGRVCVRRDRRLSGIEPSPSHLSVDLESLIYRDEVALSLHLEVHGDYHGARPDQQHGMHKEKQQHAGQLGAGDKQLPAKRNARERGRGG